MSRLSIERYCFRRFRIRLPSLIKCIILFVIIYLLNVISGVQYYIWSEKSFENEYSLTMKKLNPRSLNEPNIENLLGPPTNLISNRYLIKNEYICDNENSQPRLLILVKSAIQNWKARQAIRLTWGNKAFLEQNSIKLVFVLGITEQNLTVEKESRIYGDLIQIDKIDYYYHNSYKMVMMLRWINEYCKSKYHGIDIRNYVLFIDDDYYLNLNSLLKYLNEIDQDSDLTTYQRQTFLTGYIYNQSRPRRFLNDRWYISMNDYPYDRYPPYVTAGCFLMTKFSAQIFYLASKYIRLFRFDDIYIGLLAYSMSIEIISNNQLFSSYRSSTILSNNQTGFLQKLKIFFEIENDFQSIVKPICIHGYRGQDLINIWNDIYQTNLTLSII